jgi:hypothetical protein
MSIHETQGAGNRSVAIILTIGDHAPFLEDALQSCMQQTIRPTEVLLVDRGLHGGAESLAAAFPGVVLHRQKSANRSVAQDAGLARVSSAFTVFLDADERLTPLTIEAGLACFDKNPDAWLVCGAHQIFDAAGRPASPVWQERLDRRQSDAMQLARNLIAVQAAVMYRTDRLRSLMSSDENRDVRADDDIFFRIGRIATHDCCVAEYRYDKRLMLVRSIVGSQTIDDRLPGVDIAAQPGQRLLFHHNAPQVFAAAARNLIKNGRKLESVKMLLRAARMAPLALLRTAMSRGVKAAMRRLPRSIGRHFGEALWVPDVGSVRFGDFGRTKPISIDDGSDRGKPVDRYYIERVLEDYSELVSGRVLEVGGREYTRLFGAEKVVSSNVLDINPLNPDATIVGDLGVVGALPEGVFDCIVLTQTLQYIYNLDHAMENLFRALAPGGALLITVPGISAIGRGETSTWYWEFTELSLKTLLSSRFGEINVRVQSFGNVFAAICFLTGLSLAEVGTEKLDYNDERYPVTVAACARKPLQSH